MTLGVRGMAFDPDGRVLLVRHSYSPGWHLPGGGVEHAETAETALIREMAEEGGVRVDRAELVGVFSNHQNFRNDHVLVYRVAAWTACAPAGGGEIAERGWFAPTSLPADATSGTRRRLAEALDGAPRDPHW